MFWWVFFAAAADLLVGAGVCFWPVGAVGFAVAVEVVYAALTGDGLLVGIGGGFIDENENIFRD